MNTPRLERRCMRILEFAGYTCTRVRPQSERDRFDVIAVGSTHVRLIKVRTADDVLTEAEREQLAELHTSRDVTKELWRFSRRTRRPSIEVLR